MSNELIINITGDETRIAFLHQGVLSELYIERASEVGVLGNIYKGRVQRVLPGMNAAFVEIGEEKAAFLYITDFSEELKEVDQDDDEKSDASSEEGPKETEEDFLLEPSGEAEGDFSPIEALQEQDSEELNADEIADSEENLHQDQESPEQAQPPVDPQSAPMPEQMRRRYRWGGRSNIQHVLRAGQEILVQIVKGPISTKGARITSHISLAGRYLVYMPTWNKLGVSRKIGTFEERRRLKTILKKLRPSQGGFIVRTAAAGASEAQLQQDVHFLMKLWQDILRKKEIQAAPALIQSEWGLVFRALRDLYSAKIDRIVVDDPEEYENIKAFLADLMPERLDALELYPETEPIFDRFGIEAEINRALRKKVWLKSGGYLIIDQTEALTTIDVNTGRFTGKKSLEETILKNNLEAVEEIAYQIKIRNLGGMIILDFIDMEKRGHRDKVFNALQEALKSDRAKTTITQISELGLIEMTRKRTQESLSHLLCTECPTCSGRGEIKSPKTIAYEVLRELKRDSRLFTSKKIILHIHPQVEQALKALKTKGLDEFEKKIGKRVELSPQPHYSREHFEWRLE